MTKFQLRSVYYSFSFRAPTAKYHISGNAQHRALPLVDYVRNLKITILSQRITIFDSRNERFAEGACKKYHKSVVQCKEISNNLLTFASLIGEFVIRIFVMRYPYESRITVPRITNPRITT
jgi:hypothetical protein